VWVQNYQGRPRVAPSFAENNRENNRATDVRDFLTVFFALRSSRIVATSRSIARETISERCQAMMRKPLK
jgi:hypothetical protein